MALEPNGRANIGARSTLLVSIFVVNGEDEEALCGEGWRREGMI